MPNRTPKEVLFEHVLRTAETVPCLERAQLYRALAEYSGEHTERENLMSLAADLEIADQKCREFQFQFSNRRTVTAAPSAKTKRGR